MRWASMQWQPPTTPPPCLFPLRPQPNTLSRLLQVTLEAAAELHSEALTPGLALALFEAWARLGAPPMNSRPFGLALREHIKMGRFAPQVGRVAPCPRRPGRARSCWHPWCLEPPPARPPHPPTPPLLPAAHQRSSAAGASSCDASAGLVCCSPLMM